MYNERTIAKSVRDSENGGTGKMKIGMIGCGNMAQAMIGGMLDSGEIKAEDVFVANPIVEQLEAVKEKFGVSITTNNKEVAQWADFLIFAVKPNVIGLVINEVKESIRVQDTVLVSIAAGVSLEQLAQGFEGKDIKIVRVMPNTPALVGAGMSAITGNENVAKDELESVAKICNCFGKTMVLDEKFFHGVTAASGSSPALVYILIEAMADAAVKAGISREDAYLLTAQAVMGSAKMVLETKEHPGILKDRVCSPAGTTIEMVEVLEETGFRASVQAAIDAAVQKSKQMSC